MYFRYITFDIDDIIGYQKNLKFVFISQDFGQIT